MTMEEKAHEFALESNFSDVKIYRCHFCFLIGYQLNSQNYKTTLPNLSCEARQKINKEYANTHNFIIENGIPRYGKIDFTCKDCGLYASTYLDWPYKEQPQPFHLAKQIKCGQLVMEIIMK